jgi:serine protease Do
VQGGVMVEASDGAAAAAQVGPGDVILRINNTEITNVKTFKETVAKLDTKKPVSLLIKDQDGQRFITFRPEVG